MWTNLQLNSVDTVLAHGSICNPRSRLQNASEAERVKNTVSKKGVCFSRVFLKGHSDQMRPCALATNDSGAPQKGLGSGKFTGAYFLIRKATAKGIGLKGSAEGVPTKGAQYTEWPGFSSKPPLGRRLCICQWEKRSRTNKSYRKPLYPLCKQAETPFMIKHSTVWTYLHDNVPVSTIAISPL